MEDGKINIYFELNVFKKIYILFQTFIIKFSILMLILIILICIIFKFIYKNLNSLLLTYSLINDEKSYQIINIFNISIKVEKYLYIIIIFYLKSIQIIFYILNFRKIINKSFVGIKKETEQKYIKFFKKYSKYLKFKEELLKYDLMISNMTLKPSEFIKFYNNKLEDNKFYVFENKSKKINCFINYYGTYSIMYYINKIILGENIKFKNIKYYIKKLSIIKKKNITQYINMT